MSTQVQRGDPITAEWANSLFNPLNSFVGEGYVDKDRIVVVPGSGSDSDLSVYEITDYAAYDAETLVATLRGKPCSYDSDSNAYVINSEATEENLYISLLQRHTTLEDAAALRGTYHVSWCHTGYPGIGQHVYVQTIGSRKEVTSLSDGIICYSTTTEAIPPFGVVTSSEVTLHGIRGLHVTAPNWPTGNSADSGGRELFVNSGREIPAYTDTTQRGYCLDAVCRPVLALYDTTVGAPAATVMCGPINGTFKLGKGLPGFVSYGNSNATTGTVLVKRDLRGLKGWCKASADWVDGTPPYVMVHACEQGDGGGGIYDGVSWPEVAFKVFLPRVGDRDPAIFEDDIFLYHVMDLDSSDDTEGCIAAGSYLDDKIGTVKMWNADVAGIPRGWRVYSALDGKFPFGDNSGALGSGSFGSTGTDYSYAEVRFIERYK